MVIDMQVLRGESTGRALGRKAKAWRKHGSMKIVEQSGAWIGLMAREGPTI